MSALVSVARGAVVAALLLSSLPALAQEWEWVPASPPAQAAESVEGPKRPVSTEQATREWRDWRRTARDLEKLERIMAVEGGEFSMEKYEVYRRKQAGGAVMIPLGAISIFSGFVIMVVNSFDGSSSSEDDWDGEEDAGGHDDDDGGLSPLVGLGAGMMILGAASIGIGIPLVIKGTMGKNRQRYLQRKDEILRAAYPELSLRLRVDPAGGAGLAVGVSF